MIFVQGVQNESDFLDYQLKRDTTRPEINFMQSAPDTLSFKYYWQNVQDKELRDSLSDENFRLFWNSASGMGETGKKIRNYIIPDSLVVDSAKKLLHRFESDSALFLKEQFTLRSMLIHVYPELFSTTKADTLVYVNLSINKVRILKYASDLLLKNDHPDSQITYLIYNQLLRVYPCEDVIDRIKMSIVDTENYLEKFLPEPVYVDGIELPPPTDHMYVQKIRMKAWLHKLYGLYNSVDCGDSC